MKAVSIPALSICLWLSVPTLGWAVIPKDCEPWLARLTQKAEASREASRKANQDGTRESQCAWIRIATALGAESKRFTRHCFRDFPEIRESELAKLDEKMRSLDLKKAGCDPASRAKEAARVAAEKRCSSMMKAANKIAEPMHAAKADADRKVSRDAECRLARTTIAFVRAFLRAEKACAPVVELADAKELAGMKDGIRIAEGHKKKHCR